MAQQPLATVEDLSAFVDEDIDDTNRRAAAVLRMASNFVRAYTRIAWGSGDHLDVPESIADVVVDVAARMWFNPEALVNDQIDDSRRGWGDSAAEGMYLTAANKAMLAPHVAKSPSVGGLRTVGTTRTDFPADGTIYVPTGPPPSGYPFPWYTEWP